MGRLRAPSLLLVAVVLASLLAACTVNGSVIETAEERYTFDGVGPLPNIVVETFNGRISVQVAGDGVVEARVTRRGSGTSGVTAQRDLANVDVEFERLGDAIRITARRLDHAPSLGNSGADIDVTVPAASSVELSTSNGRVESANVEGEVVVRTSNAPIVTRGGDRLDLFTTNGQITMNNPRGRLELRSSNGGIDIISAQDVVVTAQTTNDPITFSGTLAPGGHRFQTSNGDITVTLPGDASFRFDGQTSNGTVRTEFLDLETPTDISITGVSGDDPTPSVSVVARTTNGDLAVTTQRP